MSNKDAKLKNAVILSSLVVVLGAGIDISKGHSETITAEFVRNLPKGKILARTPQGDIKAGLGLVSFASIQRPQFVLGEKIEIQVTYGRYTKFKYSAVAQKAPKR